MATTEEIFKAIFEHSAAPTAIFNMDTIIVMANEAYCRVSGYSMHDIVGVSWLNQIPPDEINRLKEFHRIRLEENGEPPNEYDFSFFTKQGDRRHGHIFVKLIPGPQLICTSVVDTTEKKKAEDIIAWQREELKQNLIRMDNELAFQAVQFAKYNEHIAWVKNKLEKLRQTCKYDIPIFLESIDEILEGITSQQQAFSWVRLNENFMGSHPKFMQDLLHKHPYLTSSEIKLCTLLHLNLGTKEIAALTNQTYDSVRVARTRLRKKLKLDADDNLVGYLLRF
jgi:PAS domain S-box-containing protein